MRASVGISQVRFVAVLLVLAMLLGTSLPVRAAAAPSTPAIEAKREEAAKASRHLEDLGAELEMRTEEYQAIETDLAETRSRILQTRADLAQAIAELDAAQRGLGERAAGIYRTGDTNFLEVLIGVRGFSDFLTWLDFTRQVARSDASAVLAVKEAAARVERAETALEAREIEQTALRQQASVKRAEVEQAVRKQKAYVAGLNSEITRLVAEERARQARLAAERARRAAAAAAAAAALRNATTTSTVRRFNPGQLGGGHSEIVQIGLKYVGVPYVWGGSSPAGFDCSGLTQYVYAEAGIAIPRNSRSQFNVGAYVPVDRLDLLRAGDLVFFGHNADPKQIHHVGIYVGDGNYLHAPQTGENVQVASLVERISVRADYVGAVRP